MRLAVFAESRQPGDCTPAPGFRCSSFKRRAFVIPESSLLQHD